MNVIGSYSDVIVAGDGPTTLIPGPGSAATQRNVRSIALSSTTAGVAVVELASGGNVGAFIIEDLTPQDGLPGLAKTDDASLPVLRGSQSVRVRNLPGTVVTVTYTDWA